MVNCTYSWIHFRAATKMEQMVHMTVDTLRGFIFGHALSYQEYMLLLEQISFIHLLQLLLQSLASLWFFFSPTSQWLIMQLESFSFFYLVIGYSSAMACIIASAQTVVESFRNTSVVLSTF